MPQPTTITIQLAYASTSFSHKVETITVPFGESSEMHGMISKALHNHFNLPPAAPLKTPVFSVKREGGNTEFKGDIVFPRLWHGYAVVPGIAEPVAFLAWLDSDSDHRTSEAIPENWDFNSLNLMFPAPADSADRNVPQ